MNCFIAYRVLQASFPPSLLALLPTGPKQSVRTMKQILVTAIAAVGLGLFAGLAHAGGSAASDRTALPEPIQFQSSHATLLGPQGIAGRGMPLTFDGSRDPKVMPGNDDRGCWYDPDLPRCE